MMIKYLPTNSIYYNRRTPAGYFSETSCGRLCSNLWESSAFSYMKNFCYCYNIKPKDDKVFTTLRGVLCTTQKSILQNLLVFIKTYIYIFQSFMHVNKFRFNIDIFNVIFVCFQILEVYWSSMRKR